MEKTPQTNLVQLCKWRSFNSVYWYLDCKDTFSCIEPMEENNIFPDGNDGCFSNERIYENTDSEEATTVELKTVEPLMKELTGDLTDLNIDKRTKDVSEHKVADLVKTNSHYKNIPDTSPSSWASLFKNTNSPSKNTPGELNKTPIISVQMDDQLKVEQQNNNTQTPASLSLISMAHDDRAQKLAGNIIKIRFCCFCCRVRFRGSKALSTLHISLHRHLLAQTLC